MGIGGTHSEPSDEIIREWAEHQLESCIRLGLKPEVKPEINPDDALYNQGWWDQYCRDNKINPSSGK